MLLVRGNPDESFLEAEHAWHLEPLSSSVTRTRGNILFFGRRNAEAIRVLESARALDPAFAWNHYSLARAYLQEGDCDKATSAAAEHSRLVGVPSTIRALVLTRCGTADEARAALAGMRPRGGILPSASTAAVHAMLGDKETALRILETSLDTAFGPSSVLSVNPGFDGLRSEPRFRALLNRVRLAD